MTTTRSQSQAQSQAQAMSTPQASGASQGAESPNSTSPQESIGVPHPKEALKAPNIRNVPYPQDETYHHHYPRPFFEVRNWTETSKMGSIQCS